MARIDSLSDYLTDVASAIKEKKGDDSLISAENFDTEILNLPSQGTYQTKTISITTNGTQTITPDQNYDAINELTINTNVQGVSSNIKLFNTVTEVQQDTTSPYNCLGVVYQETYTPVVRESQFSKCMFPFEVVMDEAITTSSSLVYEVVEDEEGMSEIGGSITPTYFLFDFSWGNTFMTIHYTSLDGITYIRDDRYDLVVDFGTDIKSQYAYWNNLAGNFMKLVSNNLDGLYKNILTNVGYYKYTDSTNQYIVYNDKCIDISHLNHRDELVIVIDTISNTNRTTRYSNIPIYKPVNYTVYDKNDFSGYVFPVIDSSGAGYIIASPHWGNTNLMKYTYENEILVSTTTLTSNDIKTLPDMLQYNISLNHGYKLQDLTSTSKLINTINEAITGGGVIWSYPVTLPTSSSTMTKIEINEIVRDLQYKEIDYTVV